MVLPLTRCKTLSLNLPEPQSIQSKADNIYFPDLLTHVNETLLEKKCPHSNINKIPIQLLKEKGVPHSLALPEIQKLSCMSALFSF